MLPHTQINWSLRDMEETDLPQAFSLAEGTENVCPAHLEKWLRPYLSQPNHRSRVLLYNDLPVGGLIGHIDMALYEGHKRAVIVFVYIDPDYRFGVPPFRLLVEDFENWARDAGAIDVAMTSTSQALMHRMGYVEFETSYIKRLV